MDTFSPLVSIVIITYNASNFIIEALESTRRQTYPNIELIISDDCSTDNTIALSIEWLKYNSENFALTKIVKSSINTGVSANLNRGIKASSGQWIKPLAGDDALNENAIEEFLRFSLASNQDISISKLHLFGGNFELMQTLQRDYNNHYGKILEPGHKQRIRICAEIFIPGPGVFFSRNIYNEVNGFDENYPFCEEWPFFFKVLNAGYNIVLINKELVDYRVSDSSLCRTGSKLDKRVFNDVRAFFLNERRKEMIKRGMFMKALKQTFYYYLLNNSYDKSANGVFYNLYNSLSKIKKYFR